MGVAFGMTDVGMVRKVNEDNFLIDEKLGLVLIGDGMGGHDAGEVASATALTSVRDYVRAPDLAGGSDDDTTIPAGAVAPRRKAIVPDPDATWSDVAMPAITTLFGAIEFANHQIFAQNVAKRSPEGRGMGTTLTGFWQSFTDGPLVVFHVGDSRLYRYRPGELTQLTRDQTIYQQAIDAGKVDNLPSRNLLLQAVGPYGSIRPAIRSHAVKPRDLYLLCTDGLHGCVSDREIVKILGQATPRNLDVICAELIALAKEDGGKDNITVVLLLCDA